MEKQLGFILRKKPYRDTDYMITAFTKTSGKIHGIARYALKSKKRFGGRLEPFNLLNILIQKTSGKPTLITDVEIIKTFENLRSNINTFYAGSFVLEHLDILTMEEQPQEELFDCTVATLDKMEKKKYFLFEVLSFQLKALDICGYSPFIPIQDLLKKGISYVTFNIPKGSIAESGSKVDNINTYKFYTDVFHSERSNLQIEKTKHNIMVLGKYTEYHAEKVFKSLKFIEDITA